MPCFSKSSSSGYRHSSKPITVFSRDFLCLAECATLVKWTLLLSLFGERCYPSKFPSSALWACKAFPFQKKKKKKNPNICLRLLSSVQQPLLGKNNPVCAPIIVLISHTFSRAQGLSWSRWLLGAGPGLLWAGASADLQAASPGPRASGHLLCSPAKQVALQRKHS